TVPGGGGIVKRTMRPSAGSGRERWPIQTPVVNAASTAIAESHTHLGHPGSDDRCGVSTTSGRAAVFSTGTIRRWPLPGTVSIKRGLAASSPSDNRRRLISAELAFCFDNTKRCEQGTGNTPEAQALAKKMATAWVNFARTGNPNQPGLTWTPSDATRC